MDIRLALGILAVLAGGLFFMAYSIYSDIADAGGGADDDPAVPAARRRDADRARLRIRQRLPRHRQRRRDGHLHPLAAAAVRRRLVGLLEPAGRARRRAARSPSASFRCLPVELILQVGSSAGYAMVFALLIAAIIWNLGTWSLGLPASSSHTLIGSIVGVGVANALMRGQDGTVRRRLGPGDQDRRSAAAVAAVRLRPRRRCCCW